MALSGEGHRLKIVVVDAPQCVSVSGREPPLPADAHACPERVRRRRRRRCCTCLLVASLFFTYMLACDPRLELFERLFSRSRPADMAEPPSGGDWEPPSSIEEGGGGEADCLDQCVRLVD